MPENLLSYYERELTFLRRMGADFARRYPKIAGRLQLEASRCEDPHVERLLEGIAFLAARVHLRLDDDFPEISEALLNVVYPHYVRPIPAMSIARFDPDPDQGKKTAGLRIPKGSTLFSRPLAGQPARFRTCYDTVLWPIEVKEARWTRPHQLSPGLRSATATDALALTLGCAPDVSFGGMELDTLRFHLSGDGSVVWTLHELLGSRLEEIVIREPGGGRSVTLPPTALRAVGFGKEEGMLPFERRSFLGYRLLQEYFTFPEKFAFVDLDGLGVLREAGFESEVEIVFLIRPFERAERRQLLETGVRADTLQLGCTPIVNLYERAAEPILLTRTRTEYPLIPDVRRREQVGVHSIESVVSVSPGDGRARPLSPFYALRHGSDPQGSSSYWYASRRPALWRDDGGTEVLLSFVDLSGRPADPEGDAVTVRILCHDGQLPSRLPFGDARGDFQLEGGAPLRAITALMKPTPLLEPPIGKPLLWRLISQLSLNYLSLVEGGTEGLQELLRLHNFGDTAGGERQIQGLVGLRHEPRHSRVETEFGLGFARGHRIEIELNEEEFVGGSPYLFSSVLESFFGLYASLNSFTVLAARTLQRKEILKEWPPRAGWKPLL